jgi:3-isopropylmalate/(R)-2-methylmalate dehydratase small subunit
MALTHLSSRAIRIPRKDIDTDIIIPAKYLKVTDKAGLKEGCFAELKKNPEFPMNREEFANASILIAGANFGCGSSREHAPWALTQSGISAVISSEFADIFRGNAEKNGLLPVQLPEDEVQEILATDELIEIKIDVEKQKVIVHEKSYSFPLNTFSKMRFLEDMSDIEYLNKNREKIKKFAEKRR